MEDFQIPPNWKNPLKIPQMNNLKNHSTPKSNKNYPDRLSDNPNEHITKRISRRCMEQRKQRLENIRQLANLENSKYSPHTPGSLPILNQQIERLSRSPNRSTDKTTPNGKLIKHWKNCQSQVIKILNPTETLLDKSQCDKVFNPLRNSDETVDNVVNCPKFNPPVEDNCEKFIGDLHSRRRRKREENYNFNFNQQLVKDCLPTEDLILKQNAISSTSSVSKLTKDMTLESQRRNGSLSMQKGFQFPAPVQVEHVESDSENRNMDIRLAVNKNVSAMDFKLKSMQSNFSRISRNDTRSNLWEKLIQTNIDFRNKSDNCNISQNTSRIDSRFVEKKYKKLHVIYNFTAMNKKHLDLYKGDDVLLIGYNVSGDWAHIRNCNNETGWVPSSYIVSFDSLLKFPWYHGAISRSLAEHLLNSGINGSFLIRESESSPGNWSISLRFEGRTYHYRINEKSKSDNSVHFFISKDLTFNSLECLVNHHSINADGLAVPLYYPAPKMSMSSISNQESYTDKWEVDRTEIVMKQRLGKGQYGEVYQAYWKKYEIHVAIKTLKEETMAADDFLAEAAVMKSLKHANLVQLLGACTKEPPFYIITEYMSQGNLLNYMRNIDKSLVNWTVLTYMAVQISSAMCYLEEKKFIHRDLAARNCLVGSNNLIKVADFGLARLTIDDKTYTAKFGAKFPIKWTAPEGLAFNKFSNKSDVWAFGILLWELVTFGQTPYVNIELSDVYNLIHSGYRLEYPKNCKSEFYDIMLKCWEWEPTNRPCFKDIHGIFERKLKLKCSKLKQNISSVEKGRKSDKTSGYHSSNVSNSNERLKKFFEKKMFAEGMSKLEKCSDQERKLVVANNIDCPVEKLTGSESGLGTSGTESSADSMWRNKALDKSEGDNVDVLSQEVMSKLGKFATVEIDQFDKILAKNILDCSNETDYKSQDSLICENVGQIVENDDCCDINVSKLKNIFEQKKDNSPPPLTKTCPQIVKKSELETCIDHEGKTFSRKYLSSHLLGENAHRLIVNLKSIESKSDMHIIYDQIEIFAQQCNLYTKMLKNNPHFKFILIDLFQKLKTCSEILIDPRFQHMVSFNRTDVSENSFEEKGSNKESFDRSNDSTLNWENSTLPCDGVLLPIKKSLTVIKDFFIRHVETFKVLEQEIN